jgi:hypothetical protein
MMIFSAAHCVISEFLSAVKNYCGEAIACQGLRERNAKGNITHSKLQQLQGS